MIKKVALAAILFTTPVYASNLTKSLTAQPTATGAIQQNADGTVTIGTVPVNSDVSAATIRTGTNATTNMMMADKFPYVDVTHYGANGNDTADNCTAIQSAIDNNQNSVIYFPPGIYRSSCAIVLTNASGKAFTGGLRCNGATLKFTNAGASTDTDANMQNGIVAYPKTNSSGGDTSGWGDSPLAKIEGCRIDGPAHGSSIHLANGIDFVLDKVHVRNNRYGIALESSISAKIYNSSAYNWKNAGLAFLYTANSNIYYGSSPTSTFWNDSPIVQGLALADGATDGTLACILDHGSNAERIRSFDGISCQGKTGKTGVQYGYLGRLVQPHFHGANWFESMKYGIRIVSSNANEGGSSTALPGVTAAEPNGTFTMGDMPDGYCTGGVFTGLYNSGAIIAWQPDCSGTIMWGGNFTNGATTDIKLTQGGKKFVYLGDTRGDGTPPVIQNSFGGFVNVVGATPSITSGFGTSPTINSGANSGAFRVTVGTGGTANSGVLTFNKAADIGWSCVCTNATNVSVCRAEPTSTTTVTIKNYNSSLSLTAWTAGDVLHLQCNEY